MSKDFLALEKALARPRDPVRVCWDAGGAHCLDADAPAPAGSRVFELAPVYPEWLGDGAFRQAHQLRFAYLVGAMARGITTAEMVIAAARAGGLGFFGAAGLGLGEIDDAITQISSALDRQGLSWGANIIHTPQSPGHEAAVVDLYLQRGVRRASASAYLRLSPEIVRYSASGLTRGPGGEVVRRQHVFAKVSRAEVARQFMAPAPERMLRELVEAGRLSADEATLAAQVPVAAEITAESDSGGHTDNRPAATLFSSLVQARASTIAAHGLAGDAIRIGLAGGLGTPRGVAGAFAMGAAYVLTGSVNQAAVESGLSGIGREALAEAGPVDVMMAPAADMFEQGVKVQVLKRGTLFAPRGEKLYGLYRAGARVDTLDKETRKWLEGLLGESLSEAWQQTCEFLSTSAPRTLELAENDPARQFALLCRRYLFMASQWARDGALSRKADYQIWCGPAMGAFNEWVAGSALEALQARTVRQIMWNLMEGAARQMRRVQLQGAGLSVAPALGEYRPQLFEQEQA